MKRQILTYTLLLITTIAFSQSVIIKDSETSPNTLLEIYDEGSTGSISIPTGATPSDPSGKLYNEGGTLKWNGSALGSGSGDGHSLDAADGSPTDALYADNDGKIGIGTTNPLSKLSVGGDGYSEAAIFGKTDGTAGRGVYGLASHNTGRGVYGDATGSYGRGVFGTASGLYGRGVYGEATNTGGTNYGGYFEASGSSGRGVYSEASGSWGFGVHGEASGLYGRGVVGVAYNSDDTNYGGFFQASGSTGRGVYGYATGSSGDGVFGHSSGLYGQGVVGYADNTGDVTNYGGLFTAEGKTGRGVFGYAKGSHGKAVVGNGNTSVTSYDFDAIGPGVDYGATSSIRWKRDIVEIDKPLQKLNELRGVYFNWDEEHGGHHDVGCIAEEVGKVLPEIVVYEENGIDADGMDYSKLTPLLVEAVKELKQIVDEQQKRIEYLESN